MVNYNMWPRSGKVGSMPKISLQEPAPDFRLKNYRGEEIRLSQFKGEKHVLLVLNRGFN